MTKRVKQFLDGAMFMGPSKKVSQALFLRSSGPISEAADLSVVEFGSLEVYERGAQLGHCYDPSSGIETEAGWKSKSKKILADFHARLDALLAENDGKDVRVASLTSEDGCGCIAAIFFGTEEEVLGRIRATEADLDEPAWNEDPRLTVAGS
jgi:hypothetical protein